MESEKLIQLLIIGHIAFGSIALFTGGIALLVKKGGVLHKRSGKVFYYSMLMSALLSLIISVMPNHENPFLFCIGLFSAYFLIGGYRSLRFKQKELSLKTDKIIGYLIIGIGLIMVLYPFLLQGKFNIILTVFGIAGIWSGYSDLKRFRNIPKTQANWLKLHIGKMTGGYIAAVTAFFVVNQILPGVWSWFVPGILGGIYITYQTKKLDKKKAI